MSAGVRLATREELRRILSLLEASGLPRTASRGRVGELLLAREAERIAGSAAVESYGPCALLRSVAADDEHRGLGASEAFLLTETADDLSSRLGFATVECAGNGG